MHILLIGHRGYVGTALFRFLGRRHRVTGWDQKENLFRLRPSTLARRGVDAVVNLAVMADRGSVRYQVETPTDRVNVEGARHLARCLKGTDLPWIQISTREVFGAVYGPADVARTRWGHRPRFLVDETFPFAPANFYAKSKLAAEWISESHPHSTVIRLSTCYTDASPPQGNWVPSIIRRAVEGRPIVLTGGGRAFRDPLHVNDLGRLIERVLSRRIFGETIHAGGGRDNLITLREFAHLAAPRAQIQAPPGGDLGFAFDIRKAVRLTGWKPLVLVRRRIPTLLRVARSSP